MNWFPQTIEKSRLAAQTVPLFSLPRAWFLLRWIWISLRGFGFPYLDLEILARRSAGGVAESACARLVKRYSLSPANAFPEASGPNTKAEFNQKLNRNAVPIPTDLASGRGAGVALATRTVTQILNMSPTTAKARNFYESPGAELLIEDENCRQPVIDDGGADEAQRRRSGDRQKGRT